MHLRPPPIPTSSSPSSLLLLFLFSIHSSSSFLFFLVLSSHDVLTWKITLSNWAGLASFPWCSRLFFIDKPNLKALVWQCPNGQYWIGVAPAEDLLVTGNSSFIYSTWADNNISALAPERNLSSDPSAGSKARSCGGSAGFAWWAGWEGSPPAPSVYVHPSCVPWDIQAPRVRPGSRDVSLGADQKGAPCVPTGPTVRASWDQDKAQDFTL